MAENDDPPYTAYIKETQPPPPVPPRSVASTGTSSTGNPVYSIPNKRSTTANFANTTSSTPSTQQHHYEEVNNGPEAIYDIPLDHNETQEKNSYNHLKRPKSYCYNHTGGKRFQKKKLVNVKTHSSININQKGSSNIKSSKTHKKSKYVKKCKTRKYKNRKTQNKNYYKKHIK